MFCWFLGNNTSWNDALKKDSISWRKHVTKWLGHTKLPTLVVQYENLLTRLDVELRRMLDFLEHPYTEDDIRCTLHSSMNSFHRKHSKQLDPYTPSQLKFILNEIDQVDVLLKKHNISFHNPYR